MGSTNTGEERRTATAKPAVAELRAKPKRKRDQAAKKQALIAAATKLFAHRGYEATTTREVAACAGCSEGLIHRYFKSKAGLLLALIQSRVSQEVGDLNERLPLAPTLDEEFLQLVNWEVERTWEDRDFLRVIIPRAVLDPARGRLLKRVGALRNARAIVERLKHFKKCQSLPAEQIEGLAEFIRVLGFVYGFMYPLVWRQDRGRADKIAATVAEILVRGIRPGGPIRFTYPSS
jgi:AcrR family transcriptional regulator